ncbi:hypothetical protein [Bradyrhizobium sp. 930_D9_N1_4]|uniref:hypothetical protein n=1 Tax=Bradyrhizobium sp. 930_D9_N1_4 TaxID=3240374 RepID=UPI003F8C11E2
MTRAHVVEHGVPSKAHARAGITAGFGRPIASPVQDQCRWSDSGARAIAAVQSDRPDSPSNRQNVTTLVSPHASQDSVSSPSMKRPRRNVGDEAGCWQ